MKYYKNRNVVEAARERINRLFDEFEEVVVGFSGGKDSTVLVNIALQEAEKRGRLPLKVLFIDQEAEWQNTIDYVKIVMYDERVEPWWFQMPMVITNNASSFERYNYCWAEGKENEWLHPKDPISIKENVYGKERFHDLFKAIFKYHFADKKACYFSGVRCEESPARLMALTDQLTYKDITWGKILDKKREHYTFFPLYDWSYSDIWKFIHEYKLEYNHIYDELYRLGRPIKSMRVSNLHHETAINDLTFVQEVEPALWERLAPRIAGANTIKHLLKFAFTAPKKLPFMFKNWKEYAEHLMETMIQEDENRVKLQKRIDYWERFLINDIVENDFYKVVVNTVLSSDWDLTKIGNFTCSGDFYTLKKYVQKRIHIKDAAKDYKFNKYVKASLK